MNPTDPFGLIGQVLDGQFRVDKFVGEGGFSIVYRGHHAGLDEPIAVKCLKLPSTLGSALVESFIRRFRDESRIQYRLSQGNLAIARSIGSGTTMSPTTSALVPYMVLEWLEGRSLAQEFEVRRGQGMTGRPLEEVVKLLDSAAQGLAFAHAQGVVHRDVNPGNLFLTTTRQGTMTKVLDFGVAKVVSDHALEMGPRAQTIGQIRIFAPAYGSPEQFDDSNGKVGTASDVYSLALIVLEAMRDRAVREGEHIGEFALMALDPNLRPTPRALGVPVGDAVENAFARATALRPGDRPNDVGQFWGSLKHAIREDAKSGKPAQAISGAPRAQSWKPHAPAAGQAPADRPVTADMVAPVVEVARPGSIAPPRIDSPGGVSAIDSRATVRMNSTPPPGDIGSPAAAALSATPGVSKSTIVMGQQTQRILTPVPPTTRTGQAPQGGLASTLSMDAIPPPPGPSPLQSQQMPPAQTSTLAMNTGSEKLRAARALVGELGLAAIPANAPLPADMVPAPGPSRMDVPTVMPPKPRGKGALIGLAVLVAVIAALAVLGVYRTLAAPPTSSAAPPPVTTTAAVTPAPTAPTAAPAEAPTPAATPTSTAPHAATATPVSTPTAAATTNPGPPPSPLTPLPPPGAFDPAAARTALDVMNGVLASCKRPGGKTGDGPISVTFSPDGRVQQAVIDEPPFAGSNEAACVASRFKQAHMAPFKGTPASVVYTFHIPS